MHLISSNGSLPLVERLQMLFILIFLILLLSLDFLLHPCHASTSHKMEKPAGCFEMEQRKRNNAPLCRLLHAAGFYRVGVSDKFCYVAPVQAVFSWSISGGSHSPACVH